LNLAPKFFLTGDSIGRRLLVLGVCAAFASSVWGQPSRQPRDDFWRADAPIDAIARNDNWIVIGGEFTVLGLHGLNPNPTTVQRVPYLAAFNAQPRLDNLRKNPAGHWTFDLTDGDGLGGGLMIQASETLSNPNWQTLSTVEIMGIQDPFEDTTLPPTTSRFYRLARKP